MADSPSTRTYRVLNVLGRGTFGTVYRAELQVAGNEPTELALKVLNADVQANPTLLARLRFEAQILGLIRHRAIVTVESVVRLHDRWTLVMEYVPGQTVRSMLDLHDGLPLGVVLEIAAEVAGALRAAYVAEGGDGNALKLIHRDVKPSNLQLTRAGAVKLLDFGIARGDDGADADPDLVNAQVFGSLPYMAPERLKLLDSHASDVFALALTVVRMFANQLPQARIHEPAHHAERVSQVLDLLRKRNAPLGLHSLIQAALVFDPDDRPDAEAFERACRDLRASVGGIRLREWSEANVRVDTGPTEPGEFSGMLLEEADATEKTRHLSELLGAAVPDTFDHPRTLTEATPPPSPEAAKRKRPG